MNHLSEEQLSTLKSALLERKEELENHFAANGQENSILGESLLDSTGDLSSADNHPADAGTETFERSRDLAINQALQEELQEVNNALERMEDGTYGICLISKEPIPYERLEAIPYTAYTVEHSPSREPEAGRPVEEEVMTPPAGSRSDDTFDDAGAWDSVEEYGSASSPVSPSDEGADRTDPIS